MKGGQLKICDFGVAQKLPHFKCQIEGSVGSIQYMSPQVLRGEKYTYKCDIWSIGIIFYELLHGYNPWFVSSDTRQTLTMKIGTRPLIIKESLSFVVKQFLIKALEITEEKRMNYIEFFEFTVFKNKFLSYIRSQMKMS